VSDWRERERHWRERLNKRKREVKLKRQRERNGPDYTKLKSKPEQTICTE
jgi:hypothetical protein